jgi:hypothetical protein
MHTVAVQYFAVTITIHCDWMRRRRMKTIESQTMSILLVTDISLLLKFSPFAQQKDLDCVL